MRKIVLGLILVSSLSVYCQTLGSGTTDIDGNNYSSVIIDTQEWTKENLNVSKYSDGTIIPQVTDPTEWANLTTGAWCYYNNDPLNGDTYGKLYNWYAVAGIHDNDPNTPNKSLAPADWHVPTDTEWTTLTNYLGGTSVAGGKMKATTLWNSPNQDATDSIGFKGLPGGYRDRYLSSMFSSIGENAVWWSSSEYEKINVWYHYQYYGDGNAYKSTIGKTVGLSVRLINNTQLNNHSFKTNSFNIYPNPAKASVTIDSANPSNIANQPYIITDALGKIVLKGKLNEGDTTINVEHLSKGIYCIKVANNKASKFIKE